MTLPPGTELIARRSQVTALRRGPGTGLKYVLAGEPQFRRTERLRIEVPVPPGATSAAGRLLTMQGQSLPLVVSYATQETNARLIGIAEVVLAPLAIGQYQLEVSYEASGQPEKVIYTFRIIP